MTADLNAVNIKMVRLVILPSNDLIMDSENYNLLCIGMAGKFIALRTGCGVYIARALCILFMID